MNLPYLAYHESAALVEAAAKARGFTGNDGESWHDFVEAEVDRFRESKQFPTLAKAEAWVRGQVNAGRTVYGCGTVLFQEKPATRCDYCTCVGVLSVREWTIDGEGVEAEKSLEPPCLND